MMKIEYIPIGNLRLAEYNPRQMTEKQAADLEASMRKFGLVDPIIVNRNPERTNVVIGGHQRLKIAKRLGIDKVPVVYVELDEKQEKELNLRLNFNKGEWDYDLLTGFDFYMLLDVGWDEKEANEIFKLDEIEFKESGESKINIGRNKKAEIKPVFYVNQIEIIENAILETGEQNRNNAFIKIFEFYLENNKKR